MLAGVQLDQCLIVRMARHLEIGLVQLSNSQFLENQASHACTIIVTSLLIVGQ